MQMLKTTVRHKCFASLGLLNVIDLLVNLARKNSLYNQSQRGNRPREQMCAGGSLLSDSQLIFLRSFSCDVTKIVASNFILKLCIFWRIVFGG